jgi:hypothetical protein
MEEKPSELDDIVLSLIKYILGESAFADFNKELFVSRLSEVHNNKAILKVVELRWEAISYLYCDNITECLKILKEAYKISKPRAKVPTWLKNDILIDLRNIYGIDMFEEQDRYQKLLTSSNEDVYYPLIDRFESNAKKLIMDDETKKKTGTHGHGRNTTKKY